MCGKAVAIMQDLQGPKIRTGALEAGKRVELREGATVTITTRPVPSNDRYISTTFQRLPQEVNSGNSILLSDGLIELRVEEVKGTEVRCRVVNGGELGEHQGINLPGVALRISALTKKIVRIWSLVFSIGSITLLFLSSAALMTSWRSSAFLHAPSDQSP